MMGRARIAFIALDAFPFDRLDERIAPHLISLAREGAHAPRGGTAVLSASTYPNFASLITGVPPLEHGIFTGKSWSAAELVPAWKAGPASPTLFDDCRTRGLRSVAVFGDQHLVGVCGARVADGHWPPDGRLPEDAPRGALGYGADRGVVRALESLEVESADFVFVQLDEIDTARHLHGPWCSEVREQCRATDAALGQVVEQLRSRWAETIVFVVSDHDHEAVEAGSIDLGQYVQDQGLDLIVDHDGTAAVVSGTADRDTLRSFPGVIDLQDLGGGKTLVWGAPGQQFGIDYGLAAQHGSPRTARQLAVVAGGHPLVSNLAERLRQTPPSCTTWATWAREILAPT